MNNFVNINHSINIIDSLSLTYSNSDSDLNSDFKSDLKSDLKSEESDYSNSFELFNLSPILPKHNTYFNDNNSINSYKLINFDNLSNNNILYYIYKIYDILSKKTKKLIRKQNKIYPI